MKRLLSTRPNACLLAAVALGMFALAPLSQAGGVTWQALPFPSDSPWPGPKGHLAVVSSNQITIQGQPVRSMESFSDPLIIDFDVLLQAKDTPNGFFRLAYIPVGSPTNLAFPGPSTMFFMQYEPGGTGSLGINQGSQMVATQAWSYAPFSVVASNLYHVTLNLAAGGALSLIINGQPYLLPSAASVSLSKFKLQLDGWQPLDTWQVGNIDVVPEPSTVMLVGIGFLGCLAAIRRRP